MSRTIVFDLDGTLADTSRDLIAAANACFAALGRGTPLDPVADAGTAFRGGRAMLRLGFDRLDGTVDETRVDTEYPKLLAHYETWIDRETVLYPGAMEAVARLRDRGDRVAVCTNKPEGLAQTLLTRLGVRDAFGALIGADTLPVRKPDPAPLHAAIAGAGGVAARSVLVGDTVTDRETGRAAGVPVILVTFGPEGRAVEALSPEGLIHDYAGLLAEVDRLLP